MAPFILQGISIKQRLRARNVLFRFGCVMLPATILLNFAPIRECLAQAPTAATSQGDGLADRYKSAMEAFGKGEFAAAISSLQDILKQNPDGQGSDSVRFSLAAAHFNAKEYKKARERFEEYLKLSPQGPKALDSQLAIAQCQLALGDKAGAMKAFAAVAQKGGSNHDQALLAQASLLKTMGKGDEARTVLQPLLSTGIKTTEGVEAAMLLASLEAAKGARDRAFQIISLLHAHPELVDNPLELNGITFEIGDSFLNAQESKKALAAYGLVKKKEELIALQHARIQAINRKIESNSATAKGDPQRAAELLSANTTLHTTLDAAKETLALAEKTPSTLAALRLRQGRCYQEAGRHWEAVLLYESALSSDASEGLDDVLYALGSAHAELGNTEECIQTLERYLKDYPKGKSADSALFFEGVQWLRKENYEKALPAFSRLLQGYPNSKLCEQGQFLLGNTYFALAQYPQGIGEYEKYVKRYPKGEFVEEAQYRIALSHFTLGDYAKAHPEFEAYMVKYPAGPFSADVSYRIAVCYFAAKQYARAVELCDAWEAQFGYPSLRAEVFALRGDALAASEKRVEAVASYRLALANGTTDQIQQYALFEANKQFQRLGQWAESSAMFQEFVATHRDHPAVVSSIYWLTKAMIREGKSQEAKQYLSDKIAAYIGDRSKDAVEQLLSQLVHLCLKRPPSPAKETATAEAKPANSSEAAPTAPYDPAKELATYLSPTKIPESPLGKVRLKFAEAELARLTKRQQDADSIFDQISESTDPTILGASLLAQCGDRMLEKAQVDKAEALFRELMKAFPKSELLDYAYNGLGQIALRKGQFAKAIQLFDDAIDKAGASTKLKDVTLGRAKALLLTGKLDEAKPLFEQVASTREWRGECTAEAVFYLGEVLFRKGDFSGAVQFYQRVFVAYQRYHQTVAKSYIRAAECFEKLGAQKEADNHYREILRKPALANTPEAAIARKRLPAPGAQ